MFAQVRVNAERNFALRASLRCRSMRGYDCIAASRLIGCHPAKGLCCFAAYPEFLRAS